MSGAPKGHSAVRAMKKPGKLSSGEVWENLELYPTPPWATRALFEYVLPRIGAGYRTAWDCCAGLGHMFDVLKEYCSDVEGSDVHLYSAAPRDIRQADIFDRETVWPLARPGWIITNPPFVPAVDILEKALTLDGVVGVAMLLRLQWLTGADRFARVFQKHPPIVVAPFVERVPMVLGGYDPAASTATDYAWFVWLDGRPRSFGALGLFQGMMIPPCKDALWRDSDRELARRCVPGFVPPSQLKKLSPDQAGLALS